MSTLQHTHTCDRFEDEWGSFPDGIARGVGGLAARFDDTQDTARMIPALERSFILDESSCRSLCYTPVLDHGTAAHVVGNAAWPKRHGRSSRHGPRHQPGRPVFIQLRHWEALAVG